MTVNGGAAGYVRIAADLIAATFGFEAPQEGASRPLAEMPGAQQ
jgi:hypothetical protein